MPIYTKKGDKGETGLFSIDPTIKIRTSKNSLKINAIGSIDELNSFIGFTKSFSKNNSYSKIINTIQENLFTIGSILAGSNLKFTKTNTYLLEKQIDKWDAILPKLTNFILPGGSNLGSALHMCRSITRRAERALTALSQEEKVPDNIKMYLNRLSDFFFQFARFINFESHFEEKIWKR